MTDKLSVAPEFWYEGEPTDSTAAVDMAEFCRALGTLKPFPAAAQRVLALVSDPNFKVNDVRDAIEEDPALAARVLQVANSAAFGATRPFTGVGQAIIRLGSALVRDVVVSLATLGMFKDVDGQGAAIRDHCAAVAALCRIIARDFLDLKTSGFFLAGLMHDIGKLLLLQSDGAVRDTAKMEDELAFPDRAAPAEREFYGFDHAVLGAHVLRMWRIPSPTPEAIAWHHQPARAHAGVDPKVKELVSVVRIADQLDRLLLASETPDLKALEAWVKEPSFEYLDISAFQLHNSWSDLQEAREAATGMLG